MYLYVHVQQLQLKKKGHEFEEQGEVRIWEKEREGKGAMM